MEERGHDEQMERVETKKASGDDGMEGFETKKRREAMEEIKR